MLCELADAMQEVSVRVADLAKEGALMLKVAAELKLLAAYIDTEYDL